MRLLHLAPSYAPYKGGMPRAAQQAAEGLAARGHEVVLATIAHRDAPAREEKGGVRVHRLFAWPRTAVAGWPWGFGTLWRQEWDAVLIHLPFFGMQEWVALAVAFRRRTRLILWYHMDVRLGSGMSRVLARGIAWVARRTSMRRLLCEADVVFVASASYARASWLADDWERLASRRRVQPFGVDTACFTPSAPVRTDQRKRMVFVGGMDTAHYFKGVPVLLEALAGLLQRDDWQAELVGDGDLRASYEQQAKALGLEGRVQFLGRMEDLTSFYRGAWVHVLPSTDVSEAFGLVTLEAGASGVPSMVSDLPGMRDALCPGSTGWVVPAGDHAAWTAALEQALEMSVLEREAMGSAARAWVEEHASEQAYVDAIERACAGEDSAR